jgi:hypothetical protein
VTTTAGPDGRSAGAGTGLACAAVAVAAAASYATTLHAYFVGDDFGLIKVLHRKPLLHFFSLFTGSWTDNIYGVRPDELRPFIALGYQIDALGGAASPLAYHLGSIAYHVACSLIVLALARVAARSTRAAALLAGLVFAAHPAHAEAVAWISGRADSIPTLFYLGAFLAYAGWRQRPRAWRYAAALVLFFCALFSKQSAITMPVLLVAFELLVEGRRGRPLLRGLAPVAPFAALTAGYLVLRQVLFGNYVREQLLSWGLVRTFLRRQPAYVDALVSPAVVATEEVTARGVVLLALALAASAVLARVAWRRRDTSARTGPLVFFGPVWYVLTIGPLLVTYFSPRHLYLASAGLAVAWGLLFDLLTADRGPRWRAVGAAACAVLVGACAVALQAHNRHWNDAARASKALAAEAQRVARAAPAGSLVLIDAPWRTRYAYVWAWSVPFVLQPPFAEEDLTARVGVVSHYWAYCCPQEAWLADLRRQLDAWAARPNHVYVVSVSAPDPRIRTVADERAPGLDIAVRAIASATSPEDAEARLAQAVRLALQAP